MMIEENDQSDAAEVDLISQVKMGCVRDDCAQARCHDLGQAIKQICVPLWGTHDCRYVLFEGSLFTVQGNCGRVQIDFHSQNINILWNHPICGGSMSVDFVGYLTHITNY